MQTISERLRASARNLERRLAQEAEFSQFKAEALVGLEAEGLANDRLEVARVELKFSSDNEKKQKLAEEIQSLEKKAGRAARQRLIVNDACWLNRNDREPYADEIEQTKSLSVKALCPILRRGRIC